MADRALVSPDDQKVTFVELFFDLVFVFCVTQVVHLLGHGITPAALGEAVLVFWLVWWGWTQYTWALNAADTTHPLIALATLLATAVAFFLAIAIPGAFHGGGLAFAVSYVLVRGIGLALYGEVAYAAAPEQHAAVRLFTLLSLGGLAAVLAGGFFTGPAQYALWTGAIGLDLVAALVGGRSAAWNLHPEHFAERHGLFVIIALGESLIVAGAGVAGEDWDLPTLLVAIPAVAVTCALWWTYFARAKPRLDHALELEQREGDPGYRPLDQVLDGGGDVRAAPELSAAHRRGEDHEEGPRHRVDPRDRVPDRAHAGGLSLPRMRAQPAADLRLRGRSDYQAGTAERSVLRRHQVAHQPHGPVHRFHAQPALLRRDA